MFRRVSMTAPPSRNRWLSKLSPELPGNPERLGPRQDRQDPARQAGEGRKVNPADVLLDHARAQLAGVKEAVVFEQKPAPAEPVARSFREAVVNLDDARAAAVKRAQIARGK